jgi:uncharacterized protein (TIGR02246 family)
MWLLPYTADMTKKSGTLLMNGSAATKGVRAMSAAMMSPTVVHDAIAAANETFMATWGDAAGIAALYTESGQLLPPNSDVVAGRHALQAFFQGLMSMGIKAVKIETAEVEGYGDTAYEVGRYTLAGEGGQVFDRGKYIVIWKQEAGQWKLHRDIFASSLPAPK